MLVYGWNKPILFKDGDIYTDYCEECQKETQWVLARMWLFLTLYWIPFCPHGKKLVIACKQCKRHIELDPLQYELLKKLLELKHGPVKKSEAILAMISGDEILQAQLNIEQNLAEKAKLSSLPEPLQTPKVPDNSICPHCGISVEADDLFCSYCGKNTKQ